MDNGPQKVYERARRSGIEEQDPYRGHKRRESPRFGGDAHEVLSLLTDAHFLEDLNLPNVTAQTETVKGRPARELCAMREGLAMASPSASTVLAVQGASIMLIRSMAGESEREFWSEALTEGKRLAGFALSERGAGSDLQAIKAQAVPSSDGWRISGAKAWIMNAPHADAYAVFARISNQSNLTCFWVDSESDGVDAEKTETLWPGTIGEVYLDGVFVPSSNIIGSPGTGLGIAKSIFNLFRPSVGAHAVGLAEKALRLSVAYVTERQAFGRKLSDFQAVSHSLADLHSRLKAARLLVYRAADAYDANEPNVSEWSAMAKLVATETSYAVTDGCIQVHGATGLEASRGIESLLREARASRIYEGTSEIQREIIWGSLRRRMT